MSIREYLWDKKPVIAIYVAIIAFIFLFLTVFNLGLEAAVYVSSAVAMGLVFCLILEYMRRASFYKQLKLSLSNLDNKYLLSEVITEPSFLEGRIYYNILQATNKSMNDKINEYGLSVREYREYVETWVHEIKTPIAAAGLICENNRTQAMAHMDEELAKISMYVDQALYYARSGSASKDYVIKDTLLSDMVAAAVKSCSRRLIGCKATVRTEGLNIMVPADSKWVVFMLGQIIDNSIKYRSSEPLCLSFEAKEDINSVTLSVTDNGIGISTKDSGRIFDKGFTGDNGRTKGKSTGIGLYLCHKLSARLGLGIGYSPAPKQGTVISLTFPKGNVTSFLT